MAQISSYPILDPQLADKVLGSNTVDSVGAPVIGNPTVQYTFSSIKSLVDQNFFQQLQTKPYLLLTKWYPTDLEIYMKILTFIQFIKYVILKEK